jgi:DNA-binding transcriptional ArsR family regulator
MLSGLLIFDRSDGSIPGMGKKSPPNMVDPRLLKALIHPTRIRIMDILTEGPNSPSGIQRRMGDGVSLNLVGHHLKVLRDFGCVEMVDEVKRKGFTEHIYGRSKREFLTAAEWGAIDRVDRQLASTEIMRAISGDVGRAFLDGKLDEREDNHLSRTPLRVDEKGWQEIVKALEKALLAVLKAAEKSEERAKDSEEELFDARVVIMQFPMSEEASLEEDEEEG